MVSGLTLTALAGRLLRAKRQVPFGSLQTQCSSNRERGRRLRIWTEQRDTDHCAPSGKSTHVLASSCRSGMQANVCDLRFLLPTLHEYAEKRRSEGNSLLRQRPSGTR